MSTSLKFKEETIKYGHGDNAKYRIDFPFFIRNEDRNNHR